MISFSNHSVIQFERVFERDSIVLMHCLRCLNICKPSVYDFGNKDEADMNNGIRFADEFTQDALVQVVERGIGFRQLSVDRK